MNNIDQEAKAIELVLEEVRQSISSVDLLLSEMNPADMLEMVEKCVLNIPANVGAIPATMTLISISERMDDPFVLINAARRMAKTGFPANKMIDSVYQIMKTYENQIKNVTT